MVTTYIKNIEDCSFKCATGLAQKRTQKTQTTACVSIKLKVVFSSVSKPVLIYILQNITQNTRLATYIKNIEDCSFKCAIRNRSKENSKTLTTASVSIELKLVYSSISNPVLKTHTAEQYTKHASGHIYRKHRGLQLQMCKQDSLTRHLKQCWRPYTTALIWSLFSR